MVALAEEAARPTRFSDRQTAVEVSVVAAVLAVDAIWILASDFTFDGWSAVKVAVVVALLGIAAWVYRVPRPLRNCEVLCTETAVLLAFSAAAAMLSYLATSLSLPLVDDRIVAVDAALGFDWVSYVDFVNQRPWLGAMSTAVYVTTLAQVALCLILLGIMGRIEEAQRFVAAVMLGALACIAISALFPAAGALATVRPPAEFTAANQPLVDLGYKQVFFDLRAGGARHLSLDGVHGLIAFPSYHCTLSALVVLAAMRLGLVFWPILMLNVAVIFSTPIDGGHHLSDAFFGIVVALVVWAVAGAFVRGTSGSASRP